MAITDAKLMGIARRIRADVLRMTTAAGSGHPGGSLSAADIITVLYFHKMKHNPKKPNWAERDRFVLSKGHACPSLYAALAHAGYFPVKELMSLRELGSKLQGHPEKEKCEENPTCDWFNGQCYCRGFNPDGSEKEKCEQNPECSWANGQCLCRGLNPPEPEPMPGPEPEPTPSPDPARESCEQNPSCHWAGGRCLCTGFGPSTSGESGESDNLLGSEQKEDDELGESN